MILEASFTLIYDVYSTGVTYDDCQSSIDNLNMFIVQASLMAIFNQSSIDNLNMFIVQATGT
jgi:hypothetical protein